MTRIPQVIVAALLCSSVCAGLAAAQTLSVSVDPALTEQITHAARAAEADSNYSAALREYKRLLEVFPNEPGLQAPIYLAMSVDAGKAGNSEQAELFRSISHALDPSLEGRAASTSGDANLTRGGSGKGDAILAFAQLALNGYATIRASRQQQQAQQPQQGQYQQPGQASPNPQQAGGYNYPQQAYGQQGYQPPTGNQYIPTPGYSDPNAQQAQQQGQYQQPAPGQYQQQPQPDPSQMQQQPGQYQPQPQQGQYQQQPQAGQYQPTPQQGQYQQQPASGQYQPQPQAGQYQPQPQQGQYPQQPAPGQYQPQPQAGQYQPQPQQGQYQQQQSPGQYQPMQPGQYQPQPQQGQYQQQSAGYTPVAQPAPYGAPAGRNRSSATRGEESPILKVVYDRSGLGDATYFANGCGALLSTDNGDLIFTPGCGFAPRLIPAGEVWEVRLNTTVGRDVGAFHIITKKGMYLDLAPSSGNSDQARADVDALRKSLGLDR